MHCVDLGESFHFSVSPHVPFLNLLFEQIANSNEYLLDEIGVDTAENEPLEVWGKIQFIIHSPPYACPSLVVGHSSAHSGSGTFGAAVLRAGCPDGYPGFLSKRAALNWRSN